MKSSSRVETELLDALSANGGCYISAFNLIVCQLGRDWNHGYCCLNNLERRGLITCERKRSVPMVIRLVNHEQ